MLRFEGARDFPLAPEALFPKLTDARFLAACVPDGENLSSDVPDAATFKVRPSLAFMRGRLDVTLQVAEKAPPTSARLIMTSKGVGSSSTVEASLALAPHPNPPPQGGREKNEPTPSPAGGGQGVGTRLHWIAVIKELGGLLKMVPHGLIRGAAQKVLDAAWSAVEARLRQT